MSYDDLKYNERLEIDKFVESIINRTELSIEEKSEELYDYIKEKVEEV